MQASNAFEKAFLKIMLKGLNLGSPHFKIMSTQERKKSIKLFADTSMAIARGNTKWSSALLGETKKKKSTNECKSKISTCKKILRRSIASRTRMKNAEASVVARRMVKKRTRLLKRIIPGGDSLDGFSLLDETLDYVIHLRAQVNLMQSLVVALEDTNIKYHGRRIHCKKENHEELGWEDDGERAM